MPQSTVIKRSVVIAGHKTSVSLEDAFWRALNEIAMAKGMTRSNLVARTGRRELVVHVTALGAGPFSLAPGTTIATPRRQARARR
jgi:hypothetical protein